MSTTQKKRLHNKSGLEQITILTFPEATLKALDTILATSLRNGSEADGLLPTKCKFTKADDGRLSMHSKKPCYGYQLVALRRYGRDKLKRVTASKLGKDIAISHLCGSAGCCTPGHLFLETKHVNDERTHCHFVLQKIRKAQSSRYRRFVEKNKYQFCTHTPRCGMQPERDETASQEVQEILASQDSE